jgi:hypothetical protein
MESWGLQGGSAASSDAGEESRRGDIRRGRRSTDAELEAAQLRIELQRRRDARRIRREQRVKRLRIESWALKQRAMLWDRQADEMDKLAAERKVKEDNDDDSYSDSEFSESTMMVCDDDDEEERASERSDAHAPTEVYSESEQQTWALMFQQQGVALPVQR